MVRTEGSKDTYKRKRKKKAKNKYSDSYKPYESKRVDKDILKIYIWEIKPMSKEGLHNWNSSMRHKAVPIVFKPFLRIDVNISEFNNNQKIEEWCIRNIGEEGYFQIRAWGHAKNKYHCSARKIANVRLKKSPDGLSANLEPHTRLKRYGWFYNE